MLVVGVDREVGPVCFGTFATFAGAFSQPGGCPNTIAAQSPVFPPQKVFAITSEMPQALHEFALCTGGHAVVQ